jgi:hypothetical protein
MLTILLMTNDSLGRDQVSVGMPLLAMRHAAMGYCQWEAK